MYANHGDKPNPWVVTIAYSLIFFSVFSSFYTAYLYAETESEELNIPTNVSEIDDRAEKTTAPKIAFVIDDLGYSLDSGQALLELAHPLTFAVIPDTPYAKDIVKLAKQAGQQVILHVPMEPEGKKNWEEGLSVDQNQEELMLKLKAMLDEYPEVSGINNHGGSLFTSDQQRMGWVMEELAKRELYFLDSRTTNQSQAIKAAKSNNVPSTSRDVFLDNVRTKESIEAAFEKIRSLARKTGEVIAIGHPHQITIEHLERELPLLIEEGFQLTFCSELTNPPKTLQKSTEDSSKSAKFVLIAPNSSSYSH